MYFRVYSAVRVPSRTCGYPVDRESYAGGRLGSEGDHRCDTRGGHVEFVYYTGKRTREYRRGSEELRTVSTRACGVTLRFALTVFVRRSFDETDTLSSAGVRSGISPSARRRVLVVVNSLGPS